MQILHYTLRRREAAERMIDMKLTEILNKRMSVSFEVFPPKSDKPLEPLMSTLDRLNALGPDMISCTHGAGGTNKGRQSEILQYIASLGTTAMANYTCIANKKSDILELVEEYKGLGVGTFLALRGDYPKGQHSTLGDFDYGYQLIGFMRESFPELEIAGACYPEKHLESPNMETEYSVMLAKQDAGADFFVSQLCHDLDNYFRFRDRARARGVTVPMVFGLMPVLAKEATLKMALSNGCSVPKELAELIGKYGEEPDSFKKAGKELTLRCIDRLRREGVDGMHIFALNKYDDVADIVLASGLRKLC